MLRAVQTLVDDGIARPILLGRRGGDRARDCSELGLRLDLGDDVRRAATRHRTTTCSGRCWPDYQRLMGRRGIPPRGRGAAGCARAAR